MDDFGNTYETEQWFLFDGQYGYSMSTFGMFDELTIEICFEYCVNYAAQVI
jgi:hypothetical protein